MFLSAVFNPINFMQQEWVIKIGRDIYKIKICTTTFFLLCQEANGKHLPASCLYEFLNTSHWSHYSMFEHCSHQKGISKSSTF